MAEMDVVPDVEKGMLTVGADGNTANTEIAASGSPKKRKRTRKANLDKKFECKHEGCGKSYSRAEHLYRHQLNRTPSTGLSVSHLHIANMPLCQTPPSRSTDVTSRTAIARLSARTSASGIETDTRRMDRNSRSAIALPRRQITSKLRLRRRGMMEWQAIAPRPSSHRLLGWCLPHLLPPALT